MGSNAWSQRTRRLLRGGAALLVVLGIASNASAGCVAALCTADTDRNGSTDYVYVGSAGSSVTATSTSPSDDSLTVRTAAGTSTTARLWWVDSNGDMDPERAYAGASTTSSKGSLGAYGSLYVVDYDNGDVIDYAYASVQAGAIGQAAGVTFGYADAERDAWTSAPSGGVSYYQ